MTRWPRSQSQPAGTRATSSESTVPANAAQRVQKKHGLRRELSTGTQANLPAECKALRCKTCFCRYQLAKLPGGMGEHRCPWSSPSSAHTMRLRNIQGLRSTSRATGMKMQQISTARSPLTHHLYGAGSPFVRQRGNTCQSRGGFSQHPDLPAACRQRLGPPRQP